MNDLTRDSDRILSESKALVRDNREGGRHRRAPSIGQGSAKAKRDHLLKKVRNKVAFHHDRATVVGAYALVPDDLELVDFHTGTRGSTFYGAADTIAALSVSHLIGSDDPAEGQKRLSHEATRMSGLLENIIDGYLVGFAARHLGIERFRVEPNVTLRGLTSGAQAKLTFYVDDRPLRRLADGA